MQYTNANFGIINYTLTTYTPALYSATIKNKFNQHDKKADKTT